MQLQKRFPSGQKGPATVYTPQPSNWDHPVPVWAMRPPPSIWDPDYLQQLDPRYQLEQMRTVLPRPLRSQRKPTQVLPDGTIGNTQLFSGLQLHIRFAYKISQLFVYIFQLYLLAAMMKEAKMKVP